MSALAGLALIGLAALMAGSIFGFNPAWDTITKSIGSSVLASVIVYTLVSLFIDPARQASQSRAIAQYAIGVAHQSFRDIFETSLPTASFATSPKGRPDFRQAFVDLLSTSTRYDYKGNIGTFTAFRLAQTRQREEWQRLRDIRLCVLDPRAEDAVKVGAIHRLTERHEAITSAAVGAQIASLRREVYIVLVALFDVGSDLPTTVYLHRDFMFYRCEIF